VIDVPERQPSPASVPGRAIVLAGSRGSATMSIASFQPKLALPLANRPLAEYTLRALAKQGVREVALVSANRGEGYRRFLHALAARTDLGVSISLVEDASLRGTAGALKALAGFVRSEPFFVLSGHVFVESAPLREAAAFHRKHGAAMTIVAEPDTTSARHLENILLGDDGRVDRFVILHRSRDRRRAPAVPPVRGRERRRTVRSSGVYVLEAGVLELLPERGYVDIKEQLVGLLRGRGAPVHAYIVPRPLRKIDDLRAYLDLNAELVRRMATEPDLVPQGVWQVAPGVFAGHGTLIAPGASVTGPVLLGDHCDIAHGARLVGPLSVGRRTHVGSGAEVRESIVGDRVTVRRNSTVERCFVGPASAARRGERLRDAFVLNPCELGESPALLMATDSADRRVYLREPGGASWHAWKRCAYLAAKRAIDVAIAATALPLLAPLFALLAILIRRDSPGPVFYSQRRCGKDGREFLMYKFRTMEENAEELQESLTGRKDVDGPMFKMENDPRVTRVGNFLRRTSLDELPQLVNVLSGDMSLVGPRPLIMSEMDLAPAWRDLRLSVRPGITGLWQVNGRAHIAFHDWIENDIRYVREQSLGLDLRILGRTFKVLRNASNL
jgi:lipopolysaccharide/colanic/teichoic acid biosynthesis glycosyltransferase/NDP-sugar pyrophosphorylase family protein